MPLNSNPASNFATLSSFFVTPQQGSLLSSLSADKLPFFLIIVWRQTVMQELSETDILTKVTRYNLIRNARMLYIDVHERMAGNLAGKFIAVPNLVNLVAKQDFQGVGENEAKALQNCLAKIKDRNIEDLFPKEDN
jgi:hypothetical protein